MIKNIIFGVLFSLSFILFETAILSNMYFLPVIPDLLLLCILYLSFHNGSLLGSTVGFLSGFILDFLSAAPLGLNSLLRTIIGYFTGFLGNTVNMNKIVIPAFMGFVATIFKALILSFISFLYGSKILTYSLFSQLFLMELGFNTILAPIVFSFLDIFKSFLINSSDQTYAS